MTMNSDITDAVETVDLKNCNSQGNYPIGNSKQNIYSKKNCLGVESIILPGNIFLTLCRYTYNTIHMYVKHFIINSFLTIKYMSFIKKLTLVLLYLLINMLIKLSCISYIVFLSNRT